MPNKKNNLLFALLIGMVFVVEVMICQYGLLNWYAQNRLAPYEYSLEARRYVATDNTPKHLKDIIQPKKGEQTLIIIETDKQLGIYDGFFRYAFLTSQPILPGEDRYFSYDDYVNQSKDFISLGSCDNQAIACLMDSPLEAFGKEKLDNAYSLTIKEGTHLYVEGSSSLYKKLDRLGFVEKKRQINYPFLGLLFSSELFQSKGLLLFSVGLGTLLLVLVASLAHRAYLIEELEVGTLFGQSSWLYWKRCLSTIFLGLLWGNLIGFALKVEVGLVNQLVLNGFLLMMLMLSHWPFKQVFKKSLFYLSLLFSSCSLVLLLVASSSSLVFQVQMDNTHKIGEYYSFVPTKLTSNYPKAIEHYQQIKELGQMDQDNLLDMSQDQFVSFVSQRSLAKPVKFYEKQIETMMDDTYYEPVHYTNQAEIHFIIHTIYRYALFALIAMIIGLYFLLDSLSKPIIKELSVHHLAGATRLALFKKLSPSFLLLYLLTLVLCSLVYAQAFMWILLFTSGLYLLYLGVILSRSRL